VRPKKAVPKKLARHPTDGRNDGKKNRGERKNKKEKTRLKGQKKEAKAVVALTRNTPLFFLYTMLERI